MRLFVRILGGAAAGVICGVPAGCAFAWLLLHGRLHERPFDRDAWQGSDERDARAPTHVVRQAMAGDLVANVLAPGMERAAIHDLLGPPFDWPVFLGAAWFGPEDEAWWLGNEPGLFGFDDEWLYLDYGEDERLTRALVVPQDASRRRAP
jgi:hypothetical protein